MWMVSTDDRVWVVENSFWMTVCGGLWRRCGVLGFVAVSVKVAIDVDGTIEAKLGRILPPPT